MAYDLEGVIWGTGKSWEDAQIDSRAIIRSFGKKVDRVKICECSRGIYNRVEKDGGYGIPFVIGLDGVARISKKDFVKG